MRGNDAALRTCDVRVDAIGPTAAAERIIGLASRGERAAVHLCNAYTLALASRDPSFAGTIDRGDLNLIDGMPLVWVARRKGLDLEDRVYGPDLMVAVMDRGREAGLRHYLYGSSPDVVGELESRLVSRLPGLRILAAESPPFRELTGDEESALVERVAASGADIVWVGLGTPKQDVFVDRFRDRLPAVLVAVGAAFDFHAGRKKQAPAWMQDRGLEWLYRLGSEPRRLWKRYLVGNTLFLAGLVRGVEVIREDP